MSEQSSLRESRWFAIRLAALVAIAPLAIDAYLPAMPAMAAFYNVDTPRVAISVSLFLAGFAIGQLLGGSFSDRLGRKPVAIAGIFVFTLCSIAIAFSQTLEELLALRFIQAIGGGFATVTAAAMVRDCFDGARSAQVFSMIGIIMMSAPMLAPAIGATLLLQFNWQSVFIFLGLYGAILLVVLITSFKETNQHKQKLSFAKTIGSYASVLGHRGGMPYIVALAFAYATMFIFISQSAFIYVEYFGVEEKHFPWFFGANIVVMMLCNRINIRCLNNHPPQKLIFVGVTLQTLATLSLVLQVTLSEQPSLIGVLASLMLSVGALGFINANGVASALHYFPKNSGTANALIGAIEFLLGGLISSAVALMQDASLLALSLGMLACAAIAAAILVVNALVRQSVLRQSEF